MLICRFDTVRDELVNDFINRNLVGKKILELGCGSGDRTQLFCDVSTVIGVDIKSRVSLERKHKFVFFLADATKLPFGDESFDAVVSFDVVEHILDDRQFFSEAFRVCKRGGYVVLGTPNRLRLSNSLRNLLGKKIVYPLYLGPDVIHLREYTREQLITLVENAELSGECMCIWVGFVGRVNKGLRIFPSFLAPYVQYLLFFGRKQCRNDKVLV
jgi:ubiquinone/menaquinone biosynthesis C-methylase UbiE